MENNGFFPPSWIVCGFTSLVCADTCKTSCGLAKPLHSEKHTVWYQDLMAAVLLLESMLRGERFKPHWRICNMPAPSPSNAGKATLLTYTKTGFTPVHFGGVGLYPHACTSSFSCKVTRHYCNRSAEGTSHHCMHGVLFNACSAI